MIKNSLRCKLLPIALQTFLLRAQLHRAAENDKASLADAVTALRLAEPEGFISIFVEEGNPISDLLRIVLKRKLLESVRTSYVQRILSAFPEAQPLPATSNIVNLDDDLEPIEPLTAREREVLNHIAAGNSNQMIGDKLVITLSAVKKHTRNIFAKLNVNSRTQAVARARQLKLINSDE